MSLDVPGFAMISGGELSGRYVDRNGNIFRREGDNMIAENGATVSVVDQEKAGRVVGRVRPSLSPEAIQAMEDEAAGNVRAMSLRQAEKPPTAEAMMAETIGEGHSVAMEPSPEYKEEDAKVSSIMSTYTPAQVRDMLHEAAKQGDDSVLVMEGEDETSVRLNAIALASIVE